MEFAYSDRVQRLQARLLAFMDEHIHPNEATFIAQLAGAADRWQLVPVVQDLKQVAKREGLWNLFLAHSSRGAGLTNLEYAPLAEILQSPVQDGETQSYYSGSDESYRVGAML